MGACHLRFTKTYYCRKHTSHPGLEDSALTQQGDDDQFETVHESTTVLKDSVKNKMLKDHDAKTQRKED